MHVLTSSRYVIVENLRYMLSPYDANHPLWFGCRFKKYVKQGYMSGGTVHVTQSLTFLSPYQCESDTHHTLKVLSHTSLTHQEKRFISVLSLTCYWYAILCCVVLEFYIHSDDVE